MRQIYVWDMFVRVFHWSLVALFLISYWTGDEKESIHTFSGYSIAALVLARIIWGVVGSKYARFSEFIRGPKEAIIYLKQISSGHPKRYIGHNPAGAVMVIAILLTLATTTLSGMKLLAIEEGEGPFAQKINMSMIEPALAGENEYEKNDHGEYRHLAAPDREHNEEHEKFWKETHEFFVNLMLMLIVVHVIGVFVASKQHNESLVKAMLTGKKNSC